MLLLLPFASALLVAPHEERSFVSWMRDNSLVYTGPEYHFRLGVFLANLRWVQSFNSQRKSFRVGLTCFAASTPAEYRARLSSVPLRKLVKHEKTVIPRRFKDLPDQVDWRETGAVGPVCDQLECASGWAFAAISAQESCWKIAKGELMKLSEQNLLCCAWTEYGCDGGHADMAAYHVLLEQDGMYMLDADYPYDGIFTIQCKFDARKGVQRITGVMYTKTSDEEDMKEKCAEIGVLATGIDASHLSFEHYVGGVYDEPDCNPANLCHSVSIVGYGTLDGIDYWLCRNSYGTNWGEEGYIKMVRNRDGQCGIDMKPFLPQLD